MRSLLMTASVLVLFAASGSANAGRSDNEEVPEPPPVDEAEFRLAEYRRLQHRIKSLAQKNAWAGVNRTYTELIDTGVMPSFEDYHWGAQAARAIGDMTAARMRLQTCNRMREDREVIDWLAQIDSAYGLVTLKGDRGVVALKAVQMPFDPIKAKSIEFAQQTIQETGTYNGLLPAGDYTFGPFSVAIAPGVLGETIDVRSDEFLRAEERRAAKERRKKRH